MKDYQRKHLAIECSESSEDEQVNTAYHEAGHAVAAWLLKHKDVTVLSMYPRSGVQDAVGYIKYTPLTFNKNRTNLENNIMMLLAGAAAVSIYKKDESDSFFDKSEYESDIDDCFMYATNMCLGEHHIEVAYICWLYVKIRHMLELHHNWAAVVALASAVLNRRRIIGTKKIVGIIEEASNDAKKNAAIAEGLDICNRLRHRIYCKELMAIRVKKRIPIRPTIETAEYRAFPERVVALNTRIDLLEKRVQQIADDISETNMELRKCETRLINLGQSKEDIEIAWVEYTDKKFRISFV